MISISFAEKICVYWDDSYLYLIFGFSPLKAIIGCTKVQNLTRFLPTNNNNILLQKLNALKFKNDIGYNIYFKSALLFVFIYASGHARYFSCILHIIILHVWFYLRESANISTQRFLYRLIPPKYIFHVTFIKIRQPSLSHMLQFCTPLKIMAVFFTIP